MNYSESNPIACLNLWDWISKANMLLRASLSRLRKKGWTVFFQRTDGIGPNIFLEVQGYDDKKIYWRFFREVCTWYEQTEDAKPFILVLLFIDERYDPDNCPFLCVSPNRMIRTTLAKSLDTMKSKPGILTVLKPFGLSDKEKLPEAVSQWKSELDVLNLPKHKKERLIELLEYFILQCFPTLTLKEVQTMIRLTPLEETVAVRELIQMGIEKGKKEGKKEIAANLLKMNVDIKTIIMATGLSEDEINDLLG